MHPRTHYFGIGLFVIGAVILIIAGTIVFSAGRLFRRKIILETYFDQSIQDLDVGAPVKYRGVQVGNVQDITFVGDKYEPDIPRQDLLRYSSYVIVTMAIYQDVFGGMPAGEIRGLLEKAIGVGLRVRLVSQLLTGPVYLEADLLDPGQNPPLPIAWQPTYLYIPSAPSTITRLTQAIEKVLDKLDQINLERLLGDVEASLQAFRQSMDQLQVGAIREQVVRFFEELRVTNQQLHVLLERPEIIRTLTNLAEGSARFNTAIRQTSTRLTRVLTRLDALLKSEAIQRVLANIAPASEQLNLATRQLPDTVAAVRQTFHRLDSLVSSQQPDIEVAVQDLRQTLDALTELVENARKYPSQVLFGRPPPRLHPETEP